MGTLKDISLFGNYTFPLEGEFEGGLIMRSLAEIGTTIRKTSTQIMQLSGRQVPIAGATGATTSDDQPALEPILCPTPFSTNKESYAVRFIQHSPEQPSTSSLTPIPLDVDHDLQNQLVENINLVQEFLETRFFRKTNARVEHQRLHGDFRECNL